MMRRRLLMAFLTAGLLLPMRIGAHHAFAAEFSTTRPISLTGKVIKLTWLNPHARFTVDVQDLRGVRSQWEFVLGSPNLLIRRGWERTFLKSGDMITVTGYQARDGSRLGTVRTLLLPNGQTASFGSSGDGGPDR
jgi:hypothetical protein